MLKYWVLAIAVTAGLGLIVMFILWLATSRIPNGLGKILFLSAVAAFLMIPHVEPRIGGYVGPGWFYLIKHFSWEAVTVVGIKMLLLFGFLFLLGWIRIKR